MSFDTTHLGGPHRVVFDVGAFRGDFAKACVAAWPGCRVECFEPLEPKPEGLPPAVGWHPVALGQGNQTVQMWQCEFVPSSSLLEMQPLHKQAFPYTKRNHQVDVRMGNLGEYVDLVEEPALLKIDVQGYELEVLYGAGAALEEFDTIVLEVSHAPLYEGMPSFDEINDYLGAMGFAHAARIDELRHPRTNELLQSDELFV